MKVLSQIVSIILLIHSFHSLAAEPASESKQELTREEVGKTAKSAFWLSWGVQNGAQKTLDELKPKVLKQSNEFLYGRRSENKDPAFAKKYNANIAQYNRALMTYRAASAINAVSVLGLLAQFAFPVSQENREKEIYCEKNPNFTPQKTGEGKVVCRAIELDQNHKPIENITPYRSDLAYRSEYPRSERHGRDEDRASSITSNSAR